MLFSGYTFPTLKEADAMFKAESAPDWADGECCHRCRVTFSTFLRKVTDYSDIVERHSSLHSHYSPFTRFHNGGSW